MSIEETCDDILKKLYQDKIDHNDLVTMYIDAHSAIEILRKDGYIKRYNNQALENS